MKISGYLLLGTYYVLVYFFLALACVWDMGLHPTIHKLRMDISGFLLLGTYYVLVYFSTSTSLCLGQGATFYNTKTMDGYQWLPTSWYLLCAGVFLY
ncbi:hypothetical protein DPMN_183715 [Dreissena polymorpha]|uniref:Uncharacterized protein n=1 Tax=Dreissena polymorpha TaxID=45954 RepID=A0A9D4DGH9_DREPO|nr:hypothetical protein DPMN_183715 [Dreissena polymorpha]